MAEQENQTSKRRGSRWGQIVAVALLSAVVGGVASGATVKALDQQTTTSTTEQTSTKGTAKVSNLSVKTNTAMTSAYNKVSNAVVTVINLQRASQNSSSDSSLFSEFFGDDSSSSSSSSSSSKLEEASLGSGVIYSKGDGRSYIVTNNHVVSGSDAIEVILKNGTKLTAKLVGTDEVTDLAVLSVSATKISTVATFGNSSQIAPGQPVIAIGSPLDTKYASTVTQGIISAKSRTVSVTSETTGQVTGQATVIQTDAAINPGNSGGPLVNMAGQVIGINSMKFASDSEGTSVEGIGFSIPSNEVVTIINQLVKNGHVTRPALGVTVLDLSNVAATQQKTVLKLPTSVTGGAVINSVMTNSPAKAAGLKKYDVITQLGSTKVTDIATLHTALYKYNVGDTVKVHFYRDGKLQQAELKLTETTSQLEKSTSSQN